MKKILFLTGTRADFGKLKSLIKITSESPNFDVHIFTTGMHLQKEYGYTVNEIEKSGFKNIHKFENHTSEATMDLTLAKTIEGLSGFVKEKKPDLIIVHGDRVEALAGAIVGSLNNILVGHIEGGEISGTIDELIRHSVSKMSHIHFVANEMAKKRLIQMGELEVNVCVLGSPDIDIMFSETLPSLTEATNYYEIPFKEYGICMFHPVTTEHSDIKRQAQNVIEALNNDSNNYVIIYPNNDLGSSEIIDSFSALKNKSRFKIFPSIRFEYFLVLLKNCKFILGNSSAGIREAPHYGVPSIDIGNRQNKRAKSQSIIHCDALKNDILNAINKTSLVDKSLPIQSFGNGKSNEIFLDLLSNEQLWHTSCQKTFNDQKLAD
jgi:UDP-N-acetylglucosamine 2-epimerase (hydrolysing)